MGRSYNTLEERIYRLGVKKHMLAARVVDEHDVNPIFSKEDLLTSTEDDVTVSLSASDIVDPVLHDVVVGAPPVKHTQQSLGR